MPELPTLRRELIGAFAVVFAGALFVAVAGVLLIAPRLSAGYAVAYVATLLIADIAIFSWFGTQLLRRRVLDPLAGLVDGAESISAGQLDTRIETGSTQELARVSAAVNSMAQRLIDDQQKLTENIRSLNETNSLLTEARDAMVHAEKMASVGRLGAGVAHEVGNPLGAILGYLSLLGRHQEGSRLELVQAAEREAHRIDRIVRGLLDFARPREAIAQPTDVNNVVRDTVELVRTQGHFTQLQLTLALSDIELVVRADPYQLQQVLVNLLMNAAQELEETRDPFIEITTLRRQVQEPPPHLPARRRGDPPGIDYSHRRRLASTSRWPSRDPDSESGEIVEMIVRDNGPGLAPELIDKIFEPFVTTKEPGKGTGLGLAVCARLIEGMGGVIHADNAAAGGAEFRVLLPAEPAEVMTT
ncbi:MAG: HAMP domain-containing protein [Gemmatimonadetes bacterium]|nr:HAMP domain-containing protein [Gemmatimonadota bacterium]